MLSSSRKLILLPAMVGYLNILCAAAIFSQVLCPRYGSDMYRVMNYWACNRQRGSCFQEESLCHGYSDLRNCLLPQFKCVINFRCIPRTRLCNGIPDCSDGSDEWECETTSLESITTSTMPSVSVESISSYMTTTSTMFRDNEEKTTWVILPKYEDNTSSSSTTTANTMFPDSESNATLLSLSSTTTTGTILPYSETKTAFSTLTTSTMFSDSESNTYLSSSTTTNTMLPGSESNTAYPSSTTTKTMITDSEVNAYPSTLVADNTMLPIPTNKTSSPTKNPILPESSAMQPCPDNYCMQNAECMVVKGEYRCKCPSSFIGELCEIQLGNEQGFHEYAVTIATSTTLIILCLAVVSVYIYRYKRKSTWKSSDMTSRTLSQLTLTSSVLE